MEHFREATNIGKDYRPSGPQKLLDQMCQIRAKYQAKEHFGTRYGTDITMLEILKARRGLAITNAREMVNAHLGVSEFKARSYISINYSKSKALVFEDIARFILGDSDDLSILAFAENVDLEFHNDLPSWVPD